MRDVCIITNLSKIHLHHTTKETVQPSQYVCDNAIVVYTYIAYDEVSGLTKIGRSSNYQVRIQKLSRSIGNPMSLINVIAGDIEKQLHNKYREYSVGNEWFYFNESLLHELRNISSKGRVG